MNIKINEVNSFTKEIEVVVAWNDLEEYHSSAKMLVKPLVFSFPSNPQISRNQCKSAEISRNQLRATPDFIILVIHLIENQIGFLV